MKRRILNETPLITLRCGNLLMYNTHIKKTLHPIHLQATSSHRKSRTGKHHLFPTARMHMCARTYTQHSHLGKKRKGSISRDIYYQIYALVCRHIMIVPKRSRHNLTTPRQKLSMHIYLKWIEALIYFRAPNLMFYNVCY